MRHMHFWHNLTEDCFSLHDYVECYDIATIHFSSKMSVYFNYLVTTKSSFTLRLQRPKKVMHFLIVSHFSCTQTDGTDFQLIILIKNLRICTFPHCFPSFCTNGKKVGHPWSNLPFYEVLPSKWVGSLSGWFNMLHIPAYKCVREYIMYI